MFFLTDCSDVNKQKKEESETAQIPVYEKSTTQFSLLEDANLYKITYGHDGLFYYLLKQNYTEEEEPENEERQGEYQFFYQTYDKETPNSVCSITDGIVRDFSNVIKQGENRLVILTIDEQARLLEFDISGNECGEIVLDDRFGDYKQLIRMVALSNGRYILSMTNQVFFLSADGQIEDIITLDATVNNLIATQGDVLYVVAEDRLYILELQKNQVKETVKLQGGQICLFAFRDRLASVFENQVLLLHPGEDDGKVIIDLNKQDFMASQIQYMFEEQGNINIVSIDEKGVGYLITLSEYATSGNSENEGRINNPLYTDDGRKIVHVAVPKMYPYQIEFHAKKYNQINDTVHVEIERIDDTLELYLGKGNRPDVVIFNDQTELVPYIDKKLLVNMMPMVESQESYSLDDVILKAREILGAENEDEMYAMAGNFRMLMRTSDGTEYDADRKCDSTSYLKWYDKYMTENEFVGMGHLENILYASIPYFYDEGTAQANFESDEFKELLRTYKEIYERHEGGIDQSAISMEEGYTGVQIAMGPKWYATYSCPQLTEKGTTIEGLPGMDGEDHVYMILDYPMSIMNVSARKEEAFDFIMYYNSLEEFLILGDAESAYGKSGNTPARFSVYEKYLNELIYESERPYSSLGGNEYFYTDEQKEHLKELINSAVSDTKMQREIYEMFLEELDTYLNGGKELDVVCKIIQSRVGLYMQENN